MLTTFAPMPPTVPSDLPTPGTLSAARFCAADAPEVNLTTIVSSS
jgi:hypothetical protein